MGLRKVFTTDVINQFKENKETIVPELLEEIRAFGNEGKEIALEIMDLNKDDDQYYLDSFGNRISFNGNRRLKKVFTTVDLAPIHKSELEKCMNDIHYFKDNYVKIKTPKGVNFPDIRSYQNDFIDSILPDDNEDNIGLMGRQSGKSISTAIYLAWAYLFMNDINIGIVGNKGKQAREFLTNTKNILIELPIWMQTGTTVWNKSEIEGENKMRIMTDVPTSDAFRGFTIAILVVDEAAFIRTSVWEEFTDSIFPSQSGLSWKKNIILSTANGMNHYYQMVKGARDDSNGYNIFEVDWKDVPRYKPDGTVYTNEEFQEKIIKKHGIVYFNQNYANEFLGSSYTLVSSNKLGELTPKEPHEIRDGKLKIYHYPEKGHRYIMTIDPAKDGIDNFSVQITDVTDINFKQVATANLQIDYLLMPEFIYEWAEYYNFPYLIIENNEGAGQSIADQMYNDYEYTNLHFDKKTESNQSNLTKSKKKYPGFRTTPKTRKHILQTLKLFIENGRYEINDKDTIDEFYTFILISGKYQADDGCHDDLIMSLAITFAPFTNTKNFEDLRGLVKVLYTTDSEEQESIDFSELLTIGSFDDFSDEMMEGESINNHNSYNEYESYEDFITDQDGFI